MKTIGYQDGIAAFQGRMNDAVTDADPEVDGKAWPDKLAETLETMKDGHNATWGAGGLAERVAKLEAGGGPSPFFP